MRLAKLSPPKRDELALLRRALRASGYEAPANEQSKPAVVSEEAAVAKCREEARQSELSQREQASSSRVVVTDPQAARAGPLQDALQRARQAEKAAATAASRHQVSARLEPRRRPSVDSLPPRSDRALSGAAVCVESRGHARIGAAKAT